MASMTQTLDPETSIAVCEGFGKILGSDEDDDDEDYDDEDDEDRYALVDYYHYFWLMTFADHIVQCQ